MGQCKEDGYHKRRKAMDLKVWKRREREREREREERVTKGRERERKFKEENR